MHPRSTMIGIALIAVLALVLIWLPGRHAAEAQKAPSGGSMAVAAAAATSVAPQASAACEACEREHCNEIPACSAVTGNAAAGPAAGKPKSQLCEQTLACVRRTKCGSGLTINCYCGTADATECYAGQGNGPCRREIETSMESTDATTVIRRLDDITFGGGAAMSMALCDRDFCKQPCRPYFR
jgi:hypothetical protein